MKFPSRYLPDRGKPAALAVLLLTISASASLAGEAGTELFETRVRPVLVERCYECHNSRDKAEGGLALDDRAGLRAGGDSGPALVPGKPEESLLIKAIRHRKGSPRMPKGDAKLPDAVVADFARWISLGAPDPRDAPPAAEELRALTSWESIRDHRKQWWSFQPVRKPALPEPRRAGWSDHRVDRFVLADLERDGLEPAGPADRRALVRRVSFALAGLPPTPEEVERFERDGSPRAYEDLVDRLLQSPRFGERWARHWMDWLRFAESHGSEGDPAIPFAWRYRDYLIRALNDDVPYDRLVREHVAGDLLPVPRINRELNINESALGTAHYRMVPHGFAPTDALDEQATFTDNQIDVLTKGFLGLTVACARCHNHKFDPIGQSDFYALYGILASCRPALITVDTPERSQAQRPALERLRAAIKPKLADAWGRSLDDLPRRLRQPGLPLDDAAKNADDPLHAWALLRDRNGTAFAEGWATLRKHWAENRSRRDAPHSLGWDLTGPDYNAWFRHGNGLPDAPSPPGEFHLLPGGAQVVANVYPAGVYTHRLSNKHNGVLTSPRFQVEGDEIAARIAGGNNARLRLVVQNYPRATGLIYPSFEPRTEDPRWQRWSTKYWKGEWAYLEVATSEDIPVEVKPNEGRSWFGISEVVLGGPNLPANPGRPLPEAFAQGGPGSPDELAALYAATLRDCLAAWTDGTMTDAQAEFLGGFVRTRMLPNTLDALPELAASVSEYRRLEAEVPVPVRSPGVLEASPFDQPMFARGNIKKPGDPVPRRFLEVFGGAPYQTRQSGRLELAEDMVGPRNPLTARVLVNRLWHHLFGRGIVATPDNFGLLGEPPANPALLDDLAARFVEDGWSIKRMVRLIVTSKTYQMSSRASRSATERDPANLRLSHFPVRRLEAEAIRDSILAVSGRLDETRYGPGVSGRSRRRSLYVRVPRNELDPFLNVFDAPEPLTTRGRRDTTNVPAQSLTLLNDPWVLEQARAWGETIARDNPGAEDGPVIDRLFATALGRPPTPEERAECRRYLAEQDRRREEARSAAKRLETEIANRRARTAALTGPVRARLQARTKTGDHRVSRSMPVPIARWEFDTDFRDTIGTLHGEPQGNPRLENGGLVLDGSSSVPTARLDRPLSEKTLEAWVVLSDLDQRGGGVMSVETIGGGAFDAIVFGELAPREWLAGSNFFQRTKPFQGPPESEAAERPVPLAFVYRADGTIVGYRDGKPYGLDYRTDGPFRFEAGTSHVVFGLRHSPPGGNKMLKGRIARAQLYDRALSAEEVAASAGTHAEEVPEADVIAALDRPERAEFDRLKQEMISFTLTAERQRLETPRDEASGPLQRWGDLGHALFNLKEFLYVR